MQKTDFTRLSLALNYLLPAPDHYAGQFDAIPVPESESFARLQSSAAVPAIKVRRSRRIA